MKKWVSLLCIAAVCAGLLTGCGQGGIADSTGQEIKIGLNMATRDDFLTSLESAAVKAAGQDDVKMEVANANNDESVQLAQVEEWAEKGYAAAIVVLCESNAAEKVLKKAGTMPVVFVNRQPDDLDVLQSRSNVIYIGCREPDAGRMQGEYLADYFENQQLSAPQIAVIAGDDKTKTSALRMDAAEEALTKAGIAPKYIFKTEAGWIKADAQKKFAEFLKDKPQIDAVLAANDAMGIGAADALAQAGYAISTIPIVGVDATSDGRAAIRDGRLNFTVFQDPQAQGAGAVEAAIQMLGGSAPENAVDSAIWIGYTAVDAANVDKLFPDER